MKRLFGGKAPKAPAPSMDDVSGRMNERATELDRRIDEVDKQLLKYKQQIAAAKTAGAKNAAKQQALRLLKKKKMLEGQRDQTYSQQMNLESASFMQQQLKDTADQVAVMKDAQKAIASQLKTVNVDQVEALQEQMQELYYDHEEIQEVLGRSFAVQGEVDEDDLLEELDLIEDEMALEVPADAGAVPDFLAEPAENLPAAPTAVPSAPTGGMENPLGA